MIIGEKGLCKILYSKMKVGIFFHGAHILFYLENEVENVFKDCCGFFPIKTQDVWI